MGVCEWRASWISHDGGPYYTENSPLICRTNQWTGFYDKNLRHERVNALLLACIHWDLFFDYDKMIDIYASKYQRRMLLINTLGKK